MSNPPKMASVSLKRRGHSQHGSILIDVLFGTLIIGMVVTSLFLALGLANRITIRSKHVAVAKGAAEDVLESARLTGYNSLSIGSTTMPIPELPDGQRTVNITFYDPENKVKQVEAVVSWLERGRSQSIALVTLVTSGGTSQ